MIPKKGKSPSGTATCCIFSCGAITLCAAILMGYYIIPGKIWEGIMKESTLIQGDNPRYQGWAKVPIPLFQNIYLFNVTNPDQVVRGEKPILQQLGPYVYEMKLEKFNISFNEGNGTFCYRERILYYFREERSNGSLADHINFVNIPYVGAVQEASKSTVARYVLQETMKEHPGIQLFLRTTVEQLLFGGIHLPFMEMLADMQGEGPILLNHSFGLMYGQNGSNLGQFEIYSGQKHPDRFGDIVSWNGQTRWPWWENDKFCGQINGSDGIFQPYATKERVYQMFMPSLCRSFPFHFESEGSYVHGIPVYKYSIPSSFLANPQDNPDNACYFTQLSKPYPESGVFPMKGCGKGPILLSQPHFYQGSTALLNQSVGLSPDKDKHEMSMFLEPYTGTPMSVNVRFQMNIQLHPNKYFKPLKKTPSMILPLFWLEQSSGCPQSDAETIRNSLIRALQIINVVTQLAVFIGASLLLLSITMFIFYGMFQWKSCCTCTTDCSCSNTDTERRRTGIRFPFLFQSPTKKQKVYSQPPPASSSVDPSPATEALLCPSSSLSSANHVSGGN